jgi:hypothetical protein
MFVKMQIPEIKGDIQTDHKKIDNVKDENISDFMGDGFAQYPT